MPANGGSFRGVPGQYGGYAGHAAPAHALRPFSSPGPDGSGEPTMPLGSRVWRIAIVGTLQAFHYRDSGSKPETVRAMRDTMIAYDRGNATG